MAARMRCATLLLLALAAAAAAAAVPVVPSFPQVRCASLSRWLGTGRMCVDSSRSLALFPALCVSLARRPSAQDYASQMAFLAVVGGAGSRLVGTVRESMVLVLSSRSAPVHSLLSRTKTLRTTGKRSGPTVAAKAPWSSFLLTLPRCALFRLSLGVSVVAHRFCESVRFTGCLCGRSVPRLFRIHASPAGQRVGRGESRDLLHGRLVAENRYVRLLVRANLAVLPRRCVH